MREKWLQFGCFLIGYNYDLLKGCSELSRRRVLKYSSAILIPCILWAFIGYAFANRYLRLEWYYSIVGLLIMVVAVIQIERQIILSENTRKLPKILRIIIGLTMALIGSVIIDQIIFKEDIEQQKVLSTEERLKKVFPGKAEELKSQIKDIDSTILAKENERSSLIDDISRNPMLIVYTRETRTEQKDTIKNEIVVRKSNLIENPKKSMLQPIDLQISGLRIEKMKKDSILLSLRPIVEAELKKNVGFLDEMQIMFSILFNSVVAMCIWLLWFIFLLGVEAFIVINKLSDSDTDYDELMHHQMRLHTRKIELLHR
jgi:hypothetical protein